MEKDNENPYQEEIRKPSDDSATVLTGIRKAPIYTSVAVLAGALIGGGSSAFLAPPTGQNDKDKNVVPQNVQQLPTDTNFSHAANMGEVKKRIEERNEQIKAEVAPEGEKNKNGLGNKKVDLGTSVVVGVIAGGGVGLFGSLAMRELNKREEDKKEGKGHSV